MKVLNIIKNIILDIIIVILLGMIIFGILNKNKPFPVCGYYFFTVLSGSMEDTLHVGDNIIVKKSNEYKVGDIITYKLDNSYITHRITKIDGDMITTKGDANDTEDIPFNKDKILGKLAYKSKLLNFLVKNKIFIFIVVIILFVIDSIIGNMKKKVIESE